MDRAQKQSEINNFDNLSYWKNRRYDYANVEYVTGKICVAGNLEQRETADVWRLHGVCHK